MGLEFSIMSPDGLLFSSDTCYMVTLPGAKGVFSVMEGHENFWAKLEDLGGVTVYTAPEEISSEFTVKGGTASMRNGVLEVVGKEVNTL